MPYGFWTADLDATNFRSQCPQFDRVTGQVVGDEDCLFLNIFTPYNSVLGNKQHSKLLWKNVAGSIDDLIIFICKGRADPVQSEEAIRQDRQVQVRPLLPVMVWFHGGGFIRGGSQQFGPQFMMRENIVLVTVNYRLGVLGN